MRKTIILSLLFILIMPYVQGILCLDCYDGPKLDFSYRINYDKTFCSADYKNCVYNSNKLPVEGQYIAYWLNISVFSITGVNRTEDLVFFYYLIDPSERSISSNVIFIEGATISDKSSITSSQGIGIPSNYPGFWEIKSIILSRDEYLKNFNHSSPDSWLSEKYDEESFNYEKVHILSHSEYIQEVISKNSLWVSVLSLLFAFIVGLIPIYRDNKRQVDLLESLYSELNAISSKKKEIKILSKKISTKGNLQWIRELFSPGLKPAHSIWKLNTSIYISGLNRKIRRKKTGELKEVLILISQKIELIENYLNSYYQIQKNAPIFYKKDIKESILKVIDEVIELIDMTKKILEVQFRIKKK